MKTRLFEQEWKQSVSKINHRIENNVLFDFFDYLQNMKSDLKAIQKDYEEEFNKFSQKPLKHYVNLFEKRYYQYFTILIKNHKKTRSIGSIQSYNEYRDGIVFQDGEKHKINDKYYKVLKRIADSIFNIEDEMAPVVEKFWQKELTDIKDYDKNKKYFLLAHVDRKTMTEENFSEEFNIYNKSLNCMCFSAISNDKTRLYNNQYYSYNYYNNPDGLVGIIATPKTGGFVGAAYDDMLSTEYINGKCAFERYFDHSKVDRCFVRENSEIRCNGTKICPPKQIFNIDVDTINEIILDSKNMQVVAAFYLKNSRGEIPERFIKYKKEQEKLFGHKLPTIEITTRNKLHQINLDEVYGY